VDAANFAAFQAVSLDNHPIHYDIEYCKRLGYPAPLAHGLQVLSFTAAGAGIFPHVIGESLIGFIDVSARFLRGVFPGDTLYPALEITGLMPQKTTGVVTMRATVHNQKGELVLDGMHRYLLKLKG
jgi:acyl dehydratase